MKDQSIIFKGTKEGVIVEVHGFTDYKTLRTAIESKLQNTNNFFNGGSLFIDFAHACVNKECQEKIKQIILNDYKISVQDIDNKEKKEFSGINEGKTKFVRNTLRSGQNIEFSGNVVVIGDINPGGQVKAGGNVIVMGILRGMVHAGSSGNKKAIIAAFSLQPTQLRIADIISRPPDGQLLKPGNPELARIKGENIIIEPYILNKYF